VLDVNNNEMIMPFNLFTRNTEKTFSGSRLPMRILTNAWAETAGYVPGRTRVVALRLSEKSKQRKEQSVPVLDFLSGHRKGGCGFATGVDVDV